jgi:hypothetical protein
MPNILNLIPVWALNGSKGADVLDKSERWILLIACIVLWLLFSQGIFFFVAAGFAYRLYTKYFPETPNRSMTLYYLSLLAFSSVLLWSMPIKT